MKLLLGHFGRLIEIEKTNVFISRKDQNHDQNVHENNFFSVFLSIGTPFVVIINIMTIIGLKSSKQG